MNITPTNAAIGTASIQGERKRMKRSNVNAALTPESRPRPPDFTLISDWPIMAHPPMPPNRPHATLATPWPTHSRLPLPRVSVSSSMSVNVISDSIRPTPARINE